MPTKFDNLRLEIEYPPIGAVKPSPTNPEIYTPAQIAKAARLIEQVGPSIPVLTNDALDILAGEYLYRAAIQSGLTTIPVIRLGHLNEAEQRALRLAHSRIAQDSRWDPERLKTEFDFLYEANFDLELTGFEVGEIDFHRFGEIDGDPETVALPDTNAVVTARVGDRFTCAGHVLVCGDTRDPDVLALAMDGQFADAVIDDGPYNCRIRGHVSGGGRVVHSEFVMGSDGIPDDEFRQFMVEWFTAHAAISRPGALHYQFMNSENLALMMEAGKAIYDFIHLCIWQKTNASWGAPYRREFECVVVFRVPGGKHIDNVKLGAHGRNRSDIWRFAGVNTFKRDRMKELHAHPTCKPVPLLAEIILDCTPTRGLVFDGFLGSGSSLLAAHKTGRRGVGVELDPKYIDVAIRRLQEATGMEAVHADGLTFAELTIARKQEALNVG